ncbi:MAG: nitroreductase family protein [Bacilli bacterium]|nr:nitroreductase family protein [Bacilli bacterium]
MEREEKDLEIMNIFEAIDKRTSRRVYLGLELNDDQIQFLEKEIELINEKSGLTFLIIRNASTAFNSLIKTYGLFKNVKSVIVLSGNKKDNNLYEKIGYYGEMVVLKATQMGLATCWVGGTFDKNDKILGNINHDEKEIVCVITIGLAQDKKSFREESIKKIVRGKSQKVEDFYEADCEVLNWFTKGIEAVQKAPSAMNSQRVKIKYNDGIIKIFIPNDRKFDMVDLGIAKLHFELLARGKFDLGNNAIFHKK